jgi:two-component sensor histidine kinase/response regulator RpfG family c-di-GMP phosphodiesterase
MSVKEKVNVLLVDDQPAKLLAYETVLQDLGENLLKASSAREALQYLLKTEVAILLIDVCMPELDGFQLAEMIREHPRFQQTAIIFISAIHLTDVDHLKGYEMGAVDYVPVPIVPEVLRAKVKVFAELYRKTRQLEQLNAELERRVAERTTELETSNARLRESERRRSLALAAGKMGSWDWDVPTGKLVWDAGQYKIFGIDPGTDLTFEDVRSFVHPEDLARIRSFIDGGGANTFQTEVRVNSPGVPMRWCICAAAMTTDLNGRVARVSGVTIDITDLKEAEARRTLLVKEVDHRARNALAIVQSIVRLTKAGSIDDYVAMVEGRIKALSNAHALLSESRWEGADLTRLVNEELAPYHNAETERISVSGPAVFLKPEPAQTIALVLHELATNAAKYGALSQPDGKVSLVWKWHEGRLDLKWQESGGPSVQQPVRKGYGMKVIVASVAQQLDGTAAFDWRQSGLRFTMSIAITGPENEPRKSSERRSGLDVSRDKGLANVAQGRRILLVEDEALVGMMMRDVLTEFGFCVIGPFGRVSDAIEIVDQEMPQAAVLDINLRGEMIYALADKLTGQGVPIVFVTGYGTDAIDGRFANVPVLQKPLDTAALWHILNAAKDGQLAK